VSGGAATGWDPERVVSADEAADLIAGQFPRLRDAPVEALATGWDNTVFLVGGQWIFRFPRRAVALPGVEREIHLLPLLAPRLSLPVPVPEFAGRPSPAFPWPFWGARLGRNELVGLQLSRRTGLVGVRLTDGRAELTGRAVVVLDGQLSPKVLT